MTDNSIFVKGARVNNLKNIDIEIPRDKLIVITGLSGSGKSSLAFDTLYAEGQRRYVESLSAYARQFLGRMSKPECDFIKGIPPAIAIEQKVNTRNPRSTVGTSTEIYDYLRLLYARIGKTISPISGKEVKKHQTEDIIRCVSNYPEGTRFSVLTTLHIPEGRTLETQLEILLKEGYNRVEYKEKTIRIEEIEHTSNIDTSSLFLIIDRMTVSSEKNTISRLADSAETAFFEGGGECILKFYTEKGIEEHTFSKRFEADGITFEEPNDLMFSFNSPVGACPTCEGFGKVIGIDENLVIPNKALSVFDDAVMCWKGEKMSEWKKNLIRVAEASHFPIHRPYYQLTEREKELLWNGNHLFGGIHDFFKMLEENQYKIQYRVMLARYRGKTVCPDCKGGRLKPQAQYVKIGGKSISELVALPITDLKIFFDTLALDEHDSIVAKRLLTEIKNRIGFLVNVGLGYLTLNRLSSTLSGGESQRINLATSLGSSLVGSLYILDEPSIGLHSRDTGQLIKVLKKLRDLGNTVIVVEHDEDIIKAADQVIDIGPQAGRLGGEVVFQGDMKALKTAGTLTADYIFGKRKIEVPARRRPWKQKITISGATENNLKNITVDIPLKIMTAITGVSGSGKSTLIKTILVPALKKLYGDYSDRTGSFDKLTGDLKAITGVEFIDQNPIGKSTRSNPVTYLKAWDDIRKIFSDTQAAKVQGFKPAHFSFNVPGGRCEECQGEGIIKVEMQFMADVFLECEHCKGRRFKDEVLEISYKGKNIYDILEMTVNQALEFFSAGNGHSERSIVDKLQKLVDVGLGYVKLGQSSSTLSGGESQRVKLAYHLSRENADPTLFVFDEPTTGLHFHDIHKLMSSLNALIERGHSVLIIEHNMDVIKCADYVIDLGPEGGKEGGRIVCTGTPEQVVKCPESYTGHYLKEKLQ